MSATGLKKLELWPTQKMDKFDEMCILLHTIPERDGWTDGRTDREKCHISNAASYWRAISDLKTQEGYLPQTDRASVFMVDFKSYFFLTSNLNKLETRPLGQGRG